MEYDICVDRKRIRKITEKNEYCACKYVLHYWFIDD